jgi:hypothetical protein
MSVFKNYISDSERQEREKNERGSKKKHEIHELLDMIFTAKANAGLLATSISMSDNCDDIVAMNV